MAAVEPQILDEGPIHEAFAEPVALDAAPRVIVDRAPPEPINELPPEVQPEGENVEWIPGYWLYSDVKQDFVWVSGLWRDAPPGRRWVPGHWLQEGDRWLWVSGFWAGVDVQEVQMLPHPPATLEAGPTSPAPGANFFWIPGCWVWGDAGYIWRPGYWYAGQANWIWVPDYYAYTPAGSIFVRGYWDRPLLRRGLLFAPVWWPARAFGFPAWSYRPYFALNAQLLLGSLYVNARHHHYWYGRGRWGHDHFHPWWAAHRGWRGYDPLRAYHRWHDGHRGNWDDHWSRRFDDQRRQLADNSRFTREIGVGGGGSGQVFIENVRGRGQVGETRLRQVQEQTLRGTQTQMAEWSRLRQARGEIETASRRPGGLAIAGDATAGVRPGLRLPTPEGSPRTEIAAGAGGRGRSAAVVGDGASPIRRGPGAGTTAGAAGRGAELRSGYRGVGPGRSTGEAAGTLGPAARPGSTVRRGGEATAGGSPTTPRIVGGRELPDGSAFRGGDPRFRPGAGDGGGPGVRGDYRPGARGTIGGGTGGGGPAGGAARAIQPPQRGAIGGSPPSFRSVTPGDGSAMPGGSLRSSPSLRSGGATAPPTMRGGGPIGGPQFRSVAPGGGPAFRGGAPSTGGGGPSVRGVSPGSSGMQFRSGGSGPSFRGGGPSGAPSMRGGGPSGGMQFRSGGGGGPSMRSVAPSGGGGRGFSGG
ncbi:MAG TPA: hypothetical protein PJ982_11830, partial [Lacipirellulaceae bacterium]|nr:hypothetical protein [Lacipirellulaceae bacterium]